MGHNRDMAVKRKKKTDLAATLRRAIRDDDRTPYAVSRDAGVDRSILVRFVNGDRSLTLGTASRLCAVLGLELRPVLSGKKGG